MDPQSPLSLMATLRVDLRLVPNDEHNVPETNQYLRSAYFGCWQPAPPIMAAFRLGTWWNAWIPSPFDKNAIARARCYMVAIMILAILDFIMIACRSLALPEQPLLEVTRFGFPVFVHSVFTKEVDTAIHHGLYQGFGYSSLLCWCQRRRSSPARPWPSPGRGDQYRDRDRFVTLRSNPTNPVLKLSLLATGPASASGGAAVAVTPPAAPVALPVLPVPKPGKQPPIHILDSTDPAEIAASRKLSLMATILAITKCFQTRLIAEKAITVPVPPLDDDLLLILHPSNIDVPSLPLPVPAVGIPPVAVPGAPDVGALPVPAKPDISVPNVPGVDTLPIPKLPGVDAPKPPVSLPNLPVEVPAPPAGLPSVPEFPVTPPTTPELPVKPEVPATPELPAVPGVPKPEVAPTPELPITPSTPELPAKPELPATPEVPELPVTPPDVPGGLLPIPPLPVTPPNVAGSLPVPEVPAAPALPGAPNLPSTEVPNLSTGELPAPPTLPIPLPTGGLHDISEADALEKVVEVGKAVLEVIISILERGASFFPLPAGIPKPPAVPAVSVPLTKRQLGAVTGVLGGSTSPLNTVTGAVGGSSSPLNAVTGATSGVTGGLPVDAGSTLGTVAGTVGSAITGGTGSAAGTALGTAGGLTGGLGPLGSATGAVSGAVGTVAGATGSVPVVGPTLGSTVGQAAASLPKPNLSSAFSSVWDLPLCLLSVANVSYRFLTPIQLEDFPLPLLRHFSAC